MTIRSGRWTARLEEPHVVFIIGMRINQLWKVHRWWPVAAAMRGMLRELNARPELGFLGGRMWAGRTAVLIQYWRSFEALEAFAKSREGQHLPAWAAFHRARRGDIGVGVFHETYCVAPGDYENVYVDMPPTLMGEVAPMFEATDALVSARGRLKGRA